MTSTNKLALGLTLVSLATYHSWGQDQANIGLQPQDSYSNSSIDHIDLSTGNMVGTIPILSYPQLGHLPSLSFSVVFNTNPWSEQMTCDPYSDQCLIYFTYADLCIAEFCGPGATDGSPGAALISSFDSVGLTVNAAITQTEVGGPPTYAIVQIAQRSFTLVDGTGAAHSLAFDISNPNWARATDGSGYSFYAEGANDPYDSQNWFTQVTGTVYDPSGNMYPGTYTNTITGATTESDPAGNTIVLNTNSQGQPQYTDSIGRQIPDPILGGVNVPISSCPNLGDPNQPAISATQWNAPGPNGGTTPYIFCYTTATVQTGFYGWSTGDAGCAYLLNEMHDDPDPLFTQSPAQLGGYMEEVCDTSTQFNGLQSIVLPNGTYWAFLYDVGSPYTYQGQTLYTESYGAVKEIQLPTGGKVDYQYQNNAQCSGCYGDPSALRVVSSRTTTDSLGNQSPKTFAYTGSYGSSSLTRETDAAGNDIMHTFAGVGGCYSPTDEMTTQYYQGPYTSNVLLKELDTSWTVEKSDCSQSWYSANALQGTVTTRTPAGIVSVDQKQYPVLFTGASYNCTPGSENCDVTGEQVTTLSQAQQESIYNGSNNLLQTAVNTPEFMQNSAYANTNQLTLLASQQILDGQGNQASLTTYGYDENNGSPTGTLGNQTSVSRWLNTSASPVVTGTVYNSQAMPSQMTDGNKNITHVNSYQCGGLYPASVTVAYNTSVAETANQQIDCNSGYIQDSTDPNGIVTEYEYDDPLGRLTRISSAVGTAQESWTSYSYPSMVQTNITQDEYIKGDGAIASGITTDGLGRTIQQHNPNGSTVTTTYNAEGLVQSVTNPFVSLEDGTYGMTSYTYDALGRRTTQTQPDGSKLQWCYDGIATSVQMNCRANASSLPNDEWVDEADESGNDRQLVSDAQGRLRSVIEPGPMETQYGYDGLGNLSQVYQKGLLTATPMSRAFSYDSLSRLITSNNPETGTICYGQWSGGTCSGGYDANGNLLYKTDARGIAIHYYYDALNRLTGKTYSDGTPSATFEYDQTGDFGAASCGASGFVQCNTIGRLSIMGTGDGLTASVFSYDAMGRVTIKSSCIASLCGSDRIDQFFSYDLAGNLTGYDHGTDVALGAYYGGHGLTYDTAGRLQSLTAYQQPSTPVTLFTATSYGPVGLLESTLGNGLNETRSYDDRTRQVSYNAVQGNPTTTASAFDGVVDSWYNNDVVRFPNLSINGSSIPENGLITVTGWVGTAQSCPVAAVEIDIDQTAIGDATLGVVRPDVQQIVYNSDGQHAACGYTFTGSIGSVAAGTHTVNAVAMDGLGNTYSIPIGANTLTVSAEAPPVANIDGTLPSQAPITNGGLMTISGWAIDSQMHAPVGSVKVLIDGMPIGYATLGIARPDVATVFNDQRYENSGWSFTGSIGTLSVGSHIASVIVYDSGGQSFVPATVTINVVADTETVSGSFDQVFNAANQTSVMPLSGTISARGWTGETQNQTSCASNISRVDVLVDGNYLGQAQLGVARADVAAAFSNQSCLNSGWQFTGSVSNIDPGFHDFTFRAYDETGGSTVLPGGGIMQINAQLSPAPMTNSLPTQYAWSLGYEPNGNVGYAFDSVNGNSAYLYDNLNRLVAAGSTNVGFQWTYDSFGNRLSQVLTSGTGTNMYQSYNAANQPIGPFDAAGNALNTGPLSYGAALSYNAESRIITAGSTTYVYDAQGQRAAKYSGSTLTNAYLYDNSGRVVTELNGSFAVTRREVYAGSRHLGTYDSNGNLEYALSDWIGTERTRANSTGTLCQTITSQPFGDNQQISGTCYPSPAFFTGKERDAESGLDYFGARYYASAMGRFMSPDPSGLTYADPTNPQNLNLYSYTINNPLKFIDPSGLALVVVCSPDPDTYSDTKDGNGYDVDTVTAGNPNCSFQDDGTDPPNTSTISQQSTNQYVQPSRSYAPSKNIFNCASEAASKVSIAGGLQALGIGTSGVGGFITNALGGNTFSGITDLASSIGSGSAGGHSVFYNMGQSVVAGPLQGLPGGSGAWGSSASGLATNAIAQGVHAAISTGGELTTLAGTASTVGLTGAEYATGVGELKLAYDALSYVGAGVGCGLGLIP